MDEQKKGQGISYFDLPTTNRLGQLIAIGYEATHREEVGAFPRPVGLIPMDVLRVWGTPCACIVPSNRMLNFDDFRPVAQHIPSAFSCFPSFSSYPLISRIGRVTGFSWT